ncbi:peptidyl-prolyl cis-trans isomerase [Aeromicrobium sp. CTD01-1L150]|uniref:peptidyl-prolyl cis-trans isomerase n=1 Tax=Aeromicrobium sp. CTD01-1L150 TaxID=3341830 RepID=UPI0035C256E4
MNVSTVIGDLRAAGVRRWLPWLLGALVVALVTAAVLTRWGPLGPGVPSGAAVVVDGDTVTTKQLDRRMDTLRALYGVVRPTGSKELDGFRRDAAKSVAVSAVLDASMSRRGIEVSDKRARDELDQFVERQFGDGGRAAFVESLGNVGTSEESVLEEIRRQVGLGMLIEEVVGDVSVGDEELEREFESRKDELATPERRTVANIVVADKAAAEDAMARLRKGETVSEVAADVSMDARTKDDGGALGEIEETDLEPAVSEAVFAVDEGQLYGPVEGRYGWNLGKVSTVKKPVPADFDRDGEAFRQTLETEQATSRWRSWLQDEIGSADIRYADDYRPDDPDALPAMGQDSSMGGGR